MNLTLFAVFIVCYKVYSIASCILPCSLIPDGLLYLAYTHIPKESGKVHSNVRQRWLQGESQVITAMYTFASYARDARKALIKH